MILPMCALKIDNAANWIELTKGGMAAGYLMRFGIT